MKYRVTNFTGFDKTDAGMAQERGPAPLVVLILILIFSVNKKQANPQKKARGIAAGDEMSQARPGVRERSGPAWSWESMPAPRRRWPPGPRG